MSAALKNRSYTLAEVKKAAQDLGVWRRLASVKLHVRQGDAYHALGGYCTPAARSLPVVEHTLASLEGAWCPCLTSSLRYSSNSTLSDLAIPILNTTRLVHLVEAAKAYPRVQILREMERILHPRSSSFLHYSSTTEELMKSASHLPLYVEARSLLAAGNARRARLALSRLTRNTWLAGLTLDHTDLLVGVAGGVFTTSTGRSLAWRDPLFSEVVEASTVAASASTTLLRLPRYAYEYFVRSLSSDVPPLSIQSSLWRDVSLDDVLVLWDPAGSGALKDLTAALETVARVS